MRVLFKEIRAGDIDAVSARVTKEPELVNAIALAPPKKDDGQSALQVAIKSGQPDIAMLLIERGADIHFRDSSPVNQWNMPVLHDAIMAAVLSARFARDRVLPGEPPAIEVLGTAERFEQAFAVLDAVLSRGADPSVPDSYGNPALMRAVLDARQIIEDPPLITDLAVDLHRVFDRLLDSGADPDWVDPRYNVTIAEQFAGEPGSEFLRL